MNLPIRLSSLWRLVYLPGFTEKLVAHPEEEKMTETDIHPIHDRLLIRVAEPEETTASGLHIPEKAQDKLPQKAIVLAVGPGRTLKSGKVVPLGLKEGDIVLVEKYHGQTVNEDLKLLIVKEDEVLAVLEDCHGD